MKVCVPEEGELSEQVKKVWIDEHLSGVTLNTWLSYSDVDGEGNFIPSLGRVHHSGLNYHHSPFLV